MEVVMTGRRGWAVGGTPKKKKECYRTKHVLSLYSSNTLKTEDKLQQDLLLQTPNS